MTAIFNPETGADGEVSPISRTYVAVRAKVAGYLRAYLRSPVGWLMLAVVFGLAAWQGHIRALNRDACAATSQTVDQQRFREAVAGDATAGGGRLFYEACRGMAVPGPNWQAQANGLF
jgi:hypothetical protein